MQNFTLTINGLNGQTSAKTAAELLERSAELVLGAATDEAVRVKCKPGEQQPKDAGLGGVRLTEKEAHEILDVLTEGKAYVSCDGAAKNAPVINLLRKALRGQRERTRQTCQIHERARVAWIEGLPIEETGLIVEVLDGEEWQQKSIRSVRADAAKEAVALAAEMRAVAEAAP